VEGWIPAQGRDDEERKTFFHNPQLPQLNTRILRILLAFFAAFLLTSPAAAWWEKGHQTTAEIAMKLVQPETKKSIDDLLRQSAKLSSPTCPAKTIEDVSVWPDCIKKLGDRYSYAYGWHFQDLETCKQFDIHAMCSGGNCVTAQIARNQRLLADRKLPVYERLMALAFLVHFVGDLHQPLHMSEHDGDQGGNKVKARWNGLDTNLHSLWDGQFTDPAIDAAPAGADGILGQVSPADRTAIAKGSIEDWAHESWDLSRSAVYGTVEPDICKPIPVNPIDVPLGLQQTLAPTIRLQIAKGGIRLARLLDEALNGDHPEVAHPPKPEVTAPTPAKTTP